MSKNRLEGHVRETIEVRPYSIGELSELYGICPRTFKKWLGVFKDELGPLVGRYYTIAQVEVIFKHLKIPYLEKVIKTTR